jgi:hypothetical protein
MVVDGVWDIPEVKCMRRGPSGRHLWMVDGGVLASLMMFTTLQSWPEIHARLRLNGRMDNRKEV